MVNNILKNMSSSMGRMTSHMLWKIKNVPNHQPVYICTYTSYIYLYIYNIRHSKGQTYVQCGKIWWHNGDYSWWFCYHIIYIYMLVTPKQIFKNDFSLSWWDVVFYLFGSCYNETIMVPWSCHDNKGENSSN